MLEKLIEWWKSENSSAEIQESSTDMIVPICYTLAESDGENQLTTATRMNFERAMSFLEIFPKAILAFGNCSYTFPGAEKVESRLKYKLFPELLSMETLEVVLNNSVQEAEEIRKVTKEKGIEPKCILIITGELHSRSVRFIWQKVFPNAKILVSCIGYKNEVQSNHLVPIQRTVPKWVFANLVRQLLLRLVGLRIRNLHHRS